MLLLALRFARSIRGIGAARPIPEGQPASVDTAQSYPFGPATAAVVEAMPSTISEELKRGERQSVARVTVHAFSKHQSEPQHEGCAVHPHQDAWQEEREQVPNNRLNHVSVLHREGMVGHKCVMTFVNCPV
eukprot:CAMPEP_0181230610 /NCGR_PEP_ID=MMETSP1096-20121128/34582_1 /TAXON_ID=156174 ORGANISM="Chrysochromulina ericina, Strain CCMP281" /NCGR_SAMPLE_ID=MMETSP1096 /ASSEMBLY_ACC=CAM_ASM_000453 /LENGTH=130 /DNA_ID=CAMNT_0023324431 /DNA_START=125 /DNA_END=517 /DNA_ORIENTATION=+